MKLDSFSNPIFSDIDLFESLYHGKELNNPNLIVESSKEISSLEEELGFQFQRELTSNSSLEEFDKALQAKWFMPEEYFTFDVKSFCLEKCTSEVEIQRVLDEIDAFEKFGMTTLLQWLKFFVDTCYENNILWGVGRGSSVSSYVLYLLEVHDVDSIKYNLDWHDFLR